MFFHLVHLALSKKYSRTVDMYKMKGWFKILFKEKYEKKLNSQTRFCQEGPDLVYFFNSSTKLGLATQFL